jgi:hypothetical protein
MPTRTGLQPKLTPEEIGERQKKQGGLLAKCRTEIVMASG